MALDQRGYVRLIEAHSGLSAIIGSQARAEVGGETLEYDGLWESSLTDSATKGLPDASIVGTESRLHTIDEILSITSKPIVVDGDTGGEPYQFEYLVRQLERRGVSAVIIEDKVFPKRNSLVASALQTLEEPEKMAEKISAGKRAALTDHFMVIARIESLIAGTGLRDALDRAETYIRAGVDGIMIHAQQKEPADLFEFAASYESLCDRLGRRPILVCVPTTYNQWSDRDLTERGFNVIIHANHLLRAAHRAMVTVAAEILANGSSRSSDSLISPVSAINTSVGFDKLNESDAERDKTLQTPVIIPAAGKDSTFPDMPKSLISVDKRPILDHQLETIRGAGLKRVVVIRGHEGAQLDQRYSGDQNLSFRENTEYEERHTLHSLMQAREDMAQGFLLVYSDILFDRDILERLLRSKHDIVLACDNSYTYHRHLVDKVLDLVISRKAFDPQYRSLHSASVFQLDQIGKKLDIGRADYEFIGMAYFSPDGARALVDAYQNHPSASSGGFHEAQSWERASITDILQEMVDRGFPVHGLETSRGWMEIHRPEDLQKAESEIASLSRRDVGR